MLNSLLNRVSSSNTSNSNNLSATFLGQSQSRYQTNNILNSSMSVDQDMLINFSYKLLIKFSHVHKFEYNIIKSYNHAIEAAPKGIIYLPLSANIFYVRLHRFHHLMYNIFRIDHYSLICNKCRFLSREKITCH